MPLVWVNCGLELAAPIDGSVLVRSIGTLLHECNSLEGSTSSVSP